VIVKFILQNFDMVDTDIVTAKQGDIVDAVPDSFQGGKVERKTHLIIGVDIGNVLTNPSHIIALRLESYTDDRLWFPEMDETKISPQILAKRRYRIPWAELISKAQTLFGITVDMNRLLDENEEYQPLEKVAFPVADLLQDKVLGKKIGATEFANIRQAIG
jgi:hypothetical protein